MDLLNLLNDGNTSRHFFADPEFASRITGVHLIKRFKGILQVKSIHMIWQHCTRICMIGTQCRQQFTRFLCMKMRWYHIQSYPLSNYRRKQLTRQYKTNFARKFSRVDCNKDILNRLLQSSDPYLSITKNLTQALRPRFMKKIVTKIQMMTMSISVMKVFKYRIMYTKSKYTIIMIIHRVSIQCTVKKTSNSFFRSHHFYVGRVKTRIKE